MQMDLNPVSRRALELIYQDSQRVTTRLAKEFGLTRQAASKHLQALKNAGLVLAQGNTRARRYYLQPIASAMETFNREGLAEDVVWREMVSPIVKDLPKNVVDIWNFGITEMVNNAIDHSDSPTVEVGIWRNAIGTIGIVADKGEGIFRKIQRVLRLYDARQAILELAKGKLTTDPENHTGEGIFFTSRAFDSFLIKSGTLSFFHDEYPVDLLTEKIGAEVGTRVTMWLRNDSDRELKAVFDQFSAPEEFTFARTVVPVRLAQYEGENLVSRSQAKRLTMRFENFRHVVLDFAEVVEIGQAFADELFRVFANAHPEVTVTSENVTREVEAMIQRAKSRMEEPR